jgi:hypothetical protein
MQMNHVSFILKLQVGKIVFFSSFFFITLDKLLFLKPFYFEVPLLRLTSPRGWISFALLLALLVLMEHSLLLWLLIIRLR